MLRYEATYGPNTKQWWLYDEETDEYVDPPLEILEELDLMGDYRTVEGMDAMRDYLEDIAAEDPDWLYDKGCRYPVTTDI